MKSLLVFGWLALFGGLFFGSKSESEQVPLMLNKTDVVLKASKGVWLANGKPFTGTVYELYTNGDTLSLSNFVDGREHGVWKTFYRRAKPHSIRHYSEGMKTGELNVWHENGQLQAWATFQNDEYDGVLKEWNEYGQQLREANYKMGYEEGAQKAWYPTGKVRSNYVVINGRRYGLLGTKNCMNVSDSVFVDR